MTETSHNLVTTAETMRRNAIRRYNESPMRTADWCEYLAVVERIEDRQKFVESSPR